MFGKCGVSEQVITVSFIKFGIMSCWCWGSRWGTAAKSTARVCPSGKRCLKTPLFARRPNSWQFPRQGNVLPSLATQRNVALDEFPYNNLFTL